MQNQKQHAIAQLLFMDNISINTHTHTYNIQTYMKNVARATNAATSDMCH